MKKEEAIEILNALAWVQGGPDREEIIAAILMAIEALSAETVQCGGRYENAMQKLREMPRYLNSIKAKQIKGVSPEAAQGEWICKGDYAVCSKCGGSSGTQFDGVEPIPRITAFCPHCSADMRERRET